jgi:GTPase SAR1 family protein
LYLFADISEMAANSKTFQFKLVLLGDSAVGKSSLVLRFSLNIMCRQLTHH